MGKLKNVVKKIVYREYVNSETYIQHLRNLGCSIGDRTKIYEPRNTYIDITRPWLINIGNDVNITRGVTILTHGYDNAVIAKLYHELMGSSGKVVIGNNVFIGMNSTVLKGVSIGNNVIIGANSLVNKNIPDNSVVAGNPCRVIMSVDEYYHKRTAEYMDEAKEMAIEYYHRYKKVPPINVFYEFYPLFLERNSDIAVANGFTFKVEGEENVFFKTSPKFNGYEEFLKWCGIPQNN
ncbi:acyltransferase [Bacillus mycoides]|uniref:acyltransferase n=1 Tax=Bacillus mycoides TaxID=1405 RepID=UPI001C339251|nr:acyltransferase [Bacillus mycoides]QWG87090.1 acyltransferase [Bacillus mycoides]